MGTRKKRFKKKIKRVQNKGRKKRHKKKVKRLVKDIKLFVGLVIMTLFICLSLFFTFYTVRKVDGYGMLPSLRNRDTIIVQKRATLKRFDLVYVDKGSESGFRRIIGLPGEKIEVKDDTLFVNDEPIDEKYLVDKINEYQSKGKNFTENFSLTSEDIEKIPEASYFVLGDNRPYTTDSRDYGLISSDNIKGKAIALLFPIDRSERL